MSCRLLGALLFFVQHLRVTAVTDGRCRHWPETIGDSEVLLRPVTVESGHLVHVDIEFGRLQAEKTHGGAGVIGVMINGLVIRREVGFGYREQQYRCLPCPLLIESYQ